MEKKQMERYDQIENFNLINKKNKVLEEKQRRNELHEQGKAILERQKNEDLKHDKEYIEKINKQIR